MNIDNRLSMLMMSKLFGSVLLGGDNGDIVHDGFKSLDYIDLARCANIDLSTPGKISPGLSGETTADPTTISGIGTLTMFNKSFALDAGTTVSKIGVYSNVAGSVTLKIGLRNSATSYTVVHSQTVSHPGTGWADFDLSTPFVVPGSGEYYVGQYVGWTSCPVVPNQPRAWVSGNATGTTTVAEHASNNAPAMRVSYSSASSMTVVGMPVTHTDVRESASAVLLVDGDPSGVSPWFSRDGGASWSGGALSTLFTQSDGSKVCLVAPVDLTAQPTGFAMAWKADTDGASLLGIAFAAA